MEPDDDRETICPCCRQMAILRPFARACDDCIADHRPDD